MFFFAIPLYVPFLLKKKTAKKKKSSILSDSTPLILQSRTLKTAKKKTSSFFFFSPEKSPELSRIRGEVKKDYILTNWVVLNWKREMIVDIPGTPGTFTGLVLRISQCVFAAASISYMVSSGAFFNYTAFW